MRNKLTAITLSLIAVLISFITATTYTVTAQTFEYRQQSFSLYCENENAEIYGKVKYSVDEYGKAIQYSEYTLNNLSNDTVLKIPFISTPYEVPDFSVTVNGKAVIGKIEYGERYALMDKNAIDFTNFYSSEIDESVLGTLYTLTTVKDSFTIEFDNDEKQPYIYSFSNSYSSSSGNGKHSFNITNATPDGKYGIYVLQNDFKGFKTTANVKKETLTLKQYLDRNITANSQYYSEIGDIEPMFFYALANYLIKSHYEINYSELFFNSISQRRLNAYSFIIQPNVKPCKVLFSMPVYVQPNNSFDKTIYLIEQAASAEYNIDYTIELNNKLPFVIESSSDLAHQSDYTYTVRNVSDDFYFIFSPTATPESLYDKNKNDNLIIILSIVITVTIFALIIGVLIFLHFKKDKKL